MRPEEEPQLPLTTRKKILLAIGGAMFFAQIAAAVAVAPPTTGAGDANAGLLAGIWAASLVWSAITVLLLVRQADLPDIATASMLVVIAAFAAFTLTAAYDARGTDAEVDLVDALFLGVTGGALNAMLVWGVALAAARLLRLPTSAAAAVHPGD